MNECARTRRHDAVFAVSRGVRAAFARRDAARARDRPLRADAGFARPRARVSRAARANPPFPVAVDQSFRGAREISRVRPIVSRLCIVYVRSHVYNMRSGPYIITPTRDRALGRPRASPMAVIAATPRS
jgi:hypothetical protein